MIKVESSGSFRNTEKFLSAMSTNDRYNVLKKYAIAGVDALANATPRASGETANAWDYRIENTKNSYSIVWTNSHIIDGRPIAILIQYGHGTGTGGYVEGRDYINPAIRPIFDKIVADVWKEVTRA